MTRLQEIEKRMSDIGTELETDAADIDALSEEVTSLKEERKQILEAAETRKKLIEEVATGTEPTVIKTFTEERKQMEFTRDSKEYRDGFIKKLQGQRLTEIEERAYTSASDSAGSAIPTLTSDRLFEKMVKIAPMLSEITLLRVAGNVKFSTLENRTDAVLHAENAAITAATDSMVEVSLGGYEYNKLIYISKTVSVMAIDAFEDWLTTILSKDMVRGIENAIINGTGSSQPKGIAYAATWATATNLVEVTGTATIAYTDIVNLISKLPAGYDAAAKFLASKSMVYQGLLNVKDTTGRPILINDSTSGYPYNLMGFPVIVSDKMPAKTLFLGDYTQIMGNLPEDITIDRDSSAGFASNSIAYRGSAMFDCKPMLSEAFVKLTTATY